MDVAQCNKAEKCHLLSIAPELRLRIYQHVYDRRPIVIIDVYNLQTMLGRGFYRAPKPSQLHLTCRTIFQEATPILYKSVKFDIRFVNYLDVPTRQEDINFGSIRTCFWLQHIRRLKLAVFMYSHADHLSRGGPVEDLVELVEVTMARLATKEVQAPELTWVKFLTKLPWHTGEADPVLRALTRVKLRGTPRVVLGHRLTSDEVRGEFLANIADGGTELDCSYKSDSEEE